MIKTCLLAGGALLFIAAPALAQDDRRIDRLDKQVRELRAIVFQGRDTGQPVVVKPAGPDPAVEAMQSRLDQMDQTLRTQSGQIEVLTHDLDEARQRASASHDAEVELKGEVKELTDQVARLQAPPAADAQAAPPPDAGAPPPSDQGGSSAADAATARAQAQDTGQLGGGSAPASEGAAYRTARSMLGAGNYPGAVDAYNAYVAQYPSGAHVREAYYGLGEAYYIRSQYGDATGAYARALKDWPKTSWAPDATVKLARALASSNRPAQACAALSEFTHRYGDKAPKAVKARADATAASAHCSG